MNSHQKEYIRHRLARAEEALQEAELLFSQRHTNVTVNRLYYACFYAVTARLLTEGYSTSRHRGVRILFDKHWIKTGRLPKESSRIFRRFYDRRRQGDYEDFTRFTAEEVQPWFVEIRHFVKTISSLIEEQIQ